MITKKPSLLSVILVAVNLTANGASLGTLDLCTYEDGNAVHEAYGCFKLILSLPADEGETGGSAILLIDEKRGGIPKENAIRGYRLVGIISKDTKLLCDKTGAAVFKKTTGMIEFLAPAGTHIKKIERFQVELIGNWNTEGVYIDSVAVGAGFPLAATNTYWADDNK
jgi:hypothetical protein